MELLFQKRGGESYLGSKGRAALARSKFLSGKVLATRSKSKEYSAIIMLKNDTGDSSLDMSSGEEEAFQKRVHKNERERLYKLKRA